MRSRELQAAVDILTGSDESPADFIVTHIGDDYAALTFLPTGIGIHLEA